MESSTIRGTSRTSIRCSGIAGIVAILLASSFRLPAQTGCGLEHTQLGAFICYPNPTEHPEDANIADVFHLSAQANASAGRKIRRYVVLFDGHRLYEKQLALPLQHISIETNLKSPFSSGQHTVSLYVDGVGTALISGLNFHPSTSVGFCDPFSRVEARSCVISTRRLPLDWSITRDAHNTLQIEAQPGARNPLPGFNDYLGLYTQNLESLEADVADATSVDAQGNLYVASHSFGDVDLRKYTPNGSLVYDSVIRSLKDGFLSIEAMSADNAGHVWISGNTTAAFSTTPNALVPAPTNQPSRPQGFAILVDTSKSGSSPVYLTYLSTVENCIRAMRVDSDGNAYLAGITASLDFPHQATFTVGEDEGRSPHTQIGFISLLNASGSAFVWSTLIRGAELNGLAIDSSNIVYAAGRSAWRRQGVVSDGIVVTGVSETGRKLSYVAHFGGSRSEEGYPIATSAAGDWVFVAGSTESREYSPGLEKQATNRKMLGSFAIALQPCRTGTIYSQLLPFSVVGSSPEIAIRPALDAFAADSAASFSKASAMGERSRQFAAIERAPQCSSPAR